MNSPAPGGRCAVVVHGGAGHDPGHADGCERAAQKAVDVLVASENSITAAVAMAIREY